MTSFLWPMRNLANGLGITWWARVETQAPDAIYWFGPFMRRSSLDAALPTFLADLRSEAPGRLEATCLRTSRQEPLTEAADLANPPEASA
jgi:hypothetical protein